MLGRGQGGEKGPSKKWCSWEGVARGVACKVLFFKKYLFFNVFGRGRSLLQHARSSVLTRDQTWVPCIGIVESQPLDHKGSSTRPS